MQEPGDLTIDQAELNEAVQALKVACEQFIAARVKLVGEDGRPMAYIGTIAVADNNETVAKMLAGVEQIVEAAGGRVVRLEESRDSTGIMSQLGICGATRTVPGELDRVCGYERMHQGPHTWQREENGHG